MHQFSRHALRLILTFPVLTAAFGQTGSVRLTITDASGAALSAQGTLTGQGATRRIPWASGPRGNVLIERLPAGDYQLSASGAGFETALLDLRVEADKIVERTITLQLAHVGTTVLVRVLPGSLDGVPGSTAEVNALDLAQLRPFSVKEGLRRVSGLHIVDEDSFGLNLNVGLRGLNPRRTQRTLLLEDGMPIHLAPYSDPTAHYHTPVELIDSIELIKGSGQIAYGPQTVGGMLNFATEAPPSKPRGDFGASLGNRDFRSAYGKLGTGGERGGILGHLLYREGDGVRDRHAHRILHTGLNGLLKLQSKQFLQLKGAYYEEDSNFSEGGMSQAQFGRNPLGNPFSNDRFNLERISAQALHGVEFKEQIRLNTNFYYQKIDRASYRQIDFAGDEMTANAATGCVGAARVNYDLFADLCGNKMRPRNYEFFGLEPRLEVRGNWLGMRHETTAGVRFHREDISRKRYNGLTPDAREASPGFLFRDWNTIRADAFATFLQTRLSAGNWTLTPGIRLETVRSRNLVLRRGNVVQNAEFDSRQTLALPGLGVTYAGLARTTVFGGIHRGFAPPRPDDNFDPLDPRVVPVAAERSTNYEAGIRSFPLLGWQLEATLFRIDFTNQIVSGQSVGIPLQTWANAGETVNSGAEFSTRYDFARLLPTGHNVFVAATYTRIFMAKFSSDQLSGGINIRGNRLPYAPGHLFSPAVTYQYRTGLNTSLSLEHVAEQFAEGLNQRTASANGQIGTIPAYTMVNAALNVPLRRNGPILFVSAMNLADRRFIVSRVDGIHVGRPRQVTGGIRWQF